MSTASSSDWIIRVPTQDLAGGGADIRSRLQTWQWKTRFGEQVSRLILDFSQTKFIEPWALALFTAYGLRVRQVNALTVEAVLAADNPCNQYVEQMGLTHVLATGDSTPHWDQSIQNTGLHVIRDHQDVSRFIKSASNLRITKAGDLMDALEYCMAEIGRNVVQHSWSKVGGIAIAQYFPDRRAIQISVADCGKGVMAALRPMYPEIGNSRESLKLAVLPHVSGAFERDTFSGSENAGLGLFFTKEICWRSGGSFWIVSNDALMGVDKNDDTARDRVYRTIEPWDGTSVTMDIPEAGVGDFAATLAVCRTLSDRARECSGPAGLDFLATIPELDGLRVIDIGAIKEDVAAAASTRDEILLPTVNSGGMLILDFGGARFVTQSFVHALLHDVFRIPGSLMRLSFLNCTKSSEEAIRAVAAYAAGYDVCVNRKRHLPRDGSL
jgi:hypothetical protein